eukprot:46752_1
MSKFILRVRHSKGTTRFELGNKSLTTVKELKQLISNQLTDHPATSTQQLTLNGKSTDTPLTNNVTLSSLHLNHGDMLYLKMVTSAIICQSSNNSRKRKIDQIVSDTPNTLPPRKRARLNNTNNSHNHNRPAQSSLTVHTLSNANNASSKSIPRNAKLSKQKPKKRTKKKKKKKQKEDFLVIKTEGETTQEIADNYLSESNALHQALSVLKPELQAMYAKEARIEAILNEKVEITEHLEQSRFTSKGRSRGK